MIEGLTIKQEISAIREALNSGDQECMSQYGGMQGAAGSVHGTPETSRSGGASERGLD